MSHTPPLLARRCILPRLKLLKTTARSTSCSSGRPPPAFRNGKRLPVSRSSEFPRRKFFAAEKESPLQGPPDSTSKNTFTLLREAPSGFFLPTHVPEISLPLPVFAVLVATLPTSADGTDISFQPSPPSTDDNSPNSSSVAAPASSTVVLDKAALEHIPPALPVLRDSAKAPDGFRSSGTP